MNECRKYKLLELISREFISIVALECMDLLLSEKQLPSLETVLLLADSITMR